MIFSAATLSPDVDVQRRLTAIHIEEWLRDDVFRVRWWGLLFLMAATLFLWWRTVDRARLPEIVLYVALSMIMVMAVVEYGEELTLWDYPTDIIPIFPPLTSMNLLCLPLIYSLVYQKFRSGERFFWAACAATAVICFIMEPLLVWGGMYHLIRWKYYYGFALYLAMAAAARGAVLKIRAIVRRAQEN